MEIGDKVRVNAVGDFYGYIGQIVAIKQHSAISRVFYRVVFDSHPWQRKGVDWAFERHELEVV